MEKNWKKILNSMKFFNGVESVFSDLPSLLKDASFEHEKDRAKLISLFSSFRHQPSQNLFLACIACLFKVKSDNSLQTTTFSDLSVSLVLHNLDDELRDMTVETCLIGLSLFPVTQLPPIIDQILRFQVPLDSSSQLVKFLSPLFFDRLSTNQQVTVVAWALKQNDLQHLSVADKPQLRGSSLSEKMNWVSKWLDLLSQQDFRFQSPFVSLHLDVDETKSGKKTSAAKIQIKGSAKHPVDLECSFDPQSTYILATLIEWESWLSEFTQEMLEDSLSSEKRHRISVEEFELAAKATNIIRVSGDKFANQLNRAKKNLNNKIKREVIHFSPSLAKTIDGHDLLMVNRGFAWINTVKRPTVTGLSLIQQARVSAPERSKRRLRPKL